MKLPSKIEKHLRAEGFGYAKPYYLRHNGRRKIDEAWLFGSHAEGFTIQAMIFYPEGESGMGISPIEVSYLYSDGTVSGPPSSDLRVAFWDRGAPEAIIEALASRGDAYLEKLGRSDLMVRVFEYLIAEPDSPISCPIEFPELARPWVLRKATPNRRRGIAAYLNLLGRFQEAESHISTIPSQLITEGDRKILSDARAGVVCVPPEAISFLREIGARGD